MRKFYHSRPLRSVLLPLLALVVLSFFFPQATNAQDAKVNISMRNTPFKDVLRKIETETSYRFFYSDDIAFMNSGVNAEFNETSVKDVLSRLLTGTNLTWKMMENNAIVISPRVAEPKSVTGMVTDETGAPFAGVAVVLKGTTTGMTTGASGEYSLDVSSVSDPVLTFSFIGYQSIERSVAAGTTLNVRMESDVMELEQIVMIGYGGVKKKDLTGSVASIRGEALVNTPVATAAEAIAGRLPGVQVTAAEGEPGGDLIIRVRGGGSITQDNSPLYVIDGFATEDGLANINPSDIESIDVAKDASSTAIYGARGANGVIFITTKKGSEGKSSVSYNGYVGVRQITNFLDVLSPYEFVMAQYEMANLPSSASSASTNFENRYGAFDQLGMYRDMKGVKWQKEVFGRSALTHNHDFSLTGGTNTTKYLVKYNRYEEEGVMVASRMARDNIRVSLDQQVSKKLKMSFNGSYTSRTVLGSGVSGNQNTSSLGNTITYRPVNGIGNDEDDLLLADEDDWANNLTNPLIKAQAQHKKRTYRNTSFNATLTYKIMDGLTLTGSAGLTADNNREYKFYDERLYDVRTTLGGPYGSIGSTERTRFTENVYMNYNKRINQNHDIGITVGQETLSYKSKYFDAGAMKFPNSDIGLDNLALGLEATNPTSKVQEETMASFFGRATYGYKDRYLLTATLRADGSSKFGKGNKWAYFPSVAFAWRASEEPFIKDLEIFNNLKVRVSYGAAGNNRINNSLYASMYNIGYYAADGNSLNNAVSPANLGNSDLKWETTVSRNLGFDFGFLRGKLNMTVDLYRNTTRDLLLNARMPSTTGYSTMLKNVGGTRNQGIEIMVNSVNFARNDFSWSTDFNISFNRGKITKMNSDLLGSEDYYLVNSNWYNAIYDYIVQVGKPVGMIYGYVSDGFYKAEDFESYDASTNKWKLKDGVPYMKGDVVTPGDMKFKWIGGQYDDDGNPVITPDTDRTIIGNTNPKFTGGVNNTFRYRNLDLSIFMNFVYGNKILNANRIAYTNTYHPYRNFLGVMKDRFRLVNDSGNFVSDLDELAALNKDAKIFRATSGSIPRYNYSWAVENGSFLRINNITLGYTLPRKVLEKMRMQTLRVYATVYNIYTVTGYSGYDPEVSSFSSNPLTPGVDFSAYPKSFSMIFGLNVTF